MGGKSDPPPAPNYTQAANATAAGNLANARYATLANRPNVYTPLGNQTWTNRGDKWTSRVSLSPQAQQTLNRQMGLSNQYAGVASDMFGQIPDAYEGGFGPTDLSDYRSKVTADTFSRMQPQLDRQKAAMETQLRNQGIKYGDEAWSNAMSDWDSKMNDLQLATDMKSGDLVNQALGTQYTMQDRPLNIVNALRTGAQVQQPTFGGFSQQAATPGPNLLGAAQSQYEAGLGATNAQNAQNANMWGGLFGLGGAALGSPWFGSVLG